jgi:uncharacterized membrane protein YjjP (DUF1212 family)
MSRKFSSWRYSFQKISTKLATYRPSSIFMAVIVVAASIFLLGGGLYDILIGPIAGYPLQSGLFLSFYPGQINDQFLMESIGVMVLLGLGTAGSLLIYRSTRYVRDPHQVSLLTKVGVALVLIAFASVEIVMYWKLNYPTS